MNEFHSPWYVEQSLLHHMLGLQARLMLRRQEVLPLLAAYLQASRPWGVNLYPKSLVGKCMAPQHLPKEACHCWARKKPSISTVCMKNK